VTLAIALVQLRTPASQAAALEHAAPLIKEAARGGARLILTPEGSNILQRDREALFSALAIEDEDPAVMGFRALAKDLGVWLAIGSALVLRADGKAANRTLVITPGGEVAARYDKIHMFDVDLPTGERHRESSSYEPGDKVVTVDVDGARLGLTICYDIRFPAVHRALALGGAEVLCVPAAFTRPTGEAHWEILLRARAIETGSFVLAAAQGGTHADGRATWGRSTVVGPWGEVLAIADHDEPCVVPARLNLEDARAARRAIPALVNARGFVGP